MSKTAIVLMAMLLLISVSGETTATSTETATTETTATTTDTATVVPTPAELIGVPFAVPEHFGGYSVDGVCGDGIPPLPMTISLGHTTGHLYINGIEAEPGTKVIPVIDGTARGVGQEDGEHYFEYLSDTRSIYWQLGVQGCSSEDGDALVSFYIEYPKGSGQYYLAEEQVVFESGVVITDLSLHDAAGTDTDSANISPSN